MYIGRILSKIPLFFSLSFLISHCRSADSPPSAPKFDSARQIAVDGQIMEGVVETFAKDEADQQKAIARQLKYSIGQFNGMGGVPAMELLTADILSVLEAPDGQGLLRVTYYAKLLISWPRERPIADSTKLFLPLGDENTFIAQYLNDEGEHKRCLAPEAHDIHTGSAWYYYRPMNRNCELHQGSWPNTAEITVKLTESAENSHDKFPEYAKIWQDQRLVVTAVFGRNEEEAIDASDDGIQAYHRMVKGLVKAYGTPLTSNLPAGRDVPGPDDDYVLMTFETPEGALDIEIDLIHKIGSAKDAAFAERFNERSKISDYISYNGHSGLGANIRGLATMGNYVKGQYQIFLLNGCDTFAYDSAALREAHRAVNPSEGPDKYFDVLTNTMPSTFYQGPGTNLVLIEALLHKEKNYRDILKGVDSRQRISVNGEQDNEPYTREAPVL